MDTEYLLGQKYEWLWWSDGYTITCALSAGQDL